MIQNKHMRVGRYILCGCAIEVWLSPADGSNAREEFTKTGFGRINIGTDNFSCKWSDVVQSVTHEVMEVAMHLNGCAFNTTSFMRLRIRDSQSYTFHFTHKEFQTIANEVGDFLCYCLPDLAKAWNKAKKQWKRRTE